MAPDLETVVKQLADSGIIAPGKLQDFVPPKADPKTVEGLVAELVKQHHLTSFQAQQVKGGKARALILGAYTILDKIGAGGMGQVFKAEHRRMKRLVAIKMLPPAMMKDAAAAARFQREVEAAAKLNHSNIVTAYDADQANGAHFLVIEYVEGRDLSALVKKNGPFPVDKAVNYVLQAARGLEFAHKKGVIHRDIKPANLLLDDEGTVKILDMGLARIEAVGDVAAAAELTGTGTIMGTVDYMAPEQGLSTKHADARADIYSLGCTLHYLILGKAAYGGETVAAKLLAHHTSPIPTLRDVKADVPEQVEDVFHKMVAKKIEDRYQTMTEVVADLEKCQAAILAASSGVNLAIDQFISDKPGHGSITFAPLAPQTIASAGQFSVTPVATPPKSKAKTRPRPSSGGAWYRNRTLLAGAGAAGLLLVALGVWVIVRGKDGKVVAKVRVPAGGSVEVRTPPSPVKREGVKTWNTPAFQAWMKSVAALPAEKQVEAVSKKLVELNPGFDGKVGPKIASGVVIGLGFAANHVSDLSPVRALTGLKSLQCRGNSGKGKLSDLSPLQGMQLQELGVTSSQVFRLSPLRGMPLTKLGIDGTNVADIAPLAGMPLTTLVFSGTHVTDLSPLKGMPLQHMQFYSTSVSSLAPLQGMPLTDLFFHHVLVSDLTPLAGMPLTNLTCYATPVFDITPLGQCKTLKSLNILDLEVSVEDVAALQKALPNCKIEWKNSQASPVGAAQSTSPASGFTPLFNGRDLTGWSTAGEGSGTWVVVDGVLSTDTPGEHYLLTERDDFADFHLRVEAKVDDGGNGGVLFRCQKNFRSVWRSAYEAQINSTQSDPQKTGSLQGLAPVTDRLVPPNTWFTLEVIAEGKRLQILVDGKQVVDYTDPGPKWQRGAIVLQEYAKHTHFRKIDIKPLGASSPANPTYTGKAFNTPAFQAWMKSVQSLPADKQVEAVSQKLMELNPGFDGNLTGLRKGTPPKIENGKVIELTIVPDGITDLSPLRVWMGLKWLDCRGNLGKGTLSDLSPLKGMQLTSLTLSYTKVTDLSPLAGMPLTWLNTDVKMLDLTFLKGMPLKTLYTGHSLLSDLSPLRGMPLEQLFCTNSQVTDLSPLEECKSLKTLNVTKTKVTAAQVAALQKALPNCKIEWDGTATLKPSGLGAGIDLLAGIDIPRDTIVGTFRRDGTSLLMPDASAKLKLPTPTPMPNEYDVEMSVERKAMGGHGFVFGFLMQGHQATVNFDSYFAPYAWAIEDINGKNGHLDNPTVNAGGRLPLNQRKTIHIKVRHTGVSVFLENQLIIDWQGKPDELSVSFWKIPDSRSLFLGSQTKFAIHNLKGCQKTQLGNRTVAA
jgi:serine/threonine protein kinase/Leucine-rich repeat (LRR) protein